MKFAVTINLDNAAFDPEPGPEIARILRDLADKVAVLSASDLPDIASWDRIKLRDLNGNYVGAASFAGGSDD